MFNRLESCCREAVGSAKSANAFHMIFYPTSIDAIMNWKLPPKGFFVNNSSYKKSSGLKIFTDSLQSVIVTGNTNIEW